MPSAYFISETVQSVLKEFVTRRLPQKLSGELNFDVMKIKSNFRDLKKKGSSYRTLVYNIKY